MRNDIVLLISFIFQMIFLDSVCDLGTFQAELVQDFADNGYLDCLRNIPPQFEETLIQKNSRLAAQWESDCAFEASDKHLKDLLQLFNIKHFYSSSGDIMQEDSDQEADLCEFIRAAIGSHIFQKQSLSNLESNFISGIDCPGEYEQTKCCAVNGYSYFREDYWTILIQGQSINFDHQFIYENAINNDQTAIKDDPEEEMGFIERKIVGEELQWIQTLKGELIVGQIVADKYWKTIDSLKTSVRESNVLVMAVIALPRLEGGLVGECWSKLSLNDIDNQFECMNDKRIDGQPYLSIKNYLIAPKIFEDFSVSLKIKCSEEQNFKNSIFLDAVLRISAFSVSKHFATKTQDSPDDILNDMQGQFHESIAWKASGLSLQFDPYDQKTIFNDLKDGFNIQPAIVFWKFSGLSQGNLSLYIQQKQLDNQDPSSYISLTKSYASCSSNQKISLFGQALTFLEINNQNQNKYIFNLKYFYIGTFDFSRNTPKASISIFLLPFKHIHMNFTITQFPYINPESYKPFPSKRNIFQSIFNKNIEINYQSLQDQFQFKKPELMHYLFMYTIILDCPDKLDAIAFRLVVKTSDSELRTLDGSYGLSDGFGTKRVVSGLGSIEGIYKQFDIGLQVNFLGQHREEVFPIDFQWFIQDQPSKSLKDFQGNYKQYEQQLIGKSLAYIDIIVTAGHINRQ